jgi:carbon storage regulator
MLVLSRRAGERIMIGDNIEIVVNWIKGDKVSLGVIAPKEINVRRNEVPKKAKEEGDA